MGSRGFLQCAVRDVLNESFAVIGWSVVGLQNFRGGSISNKSLQSSIRLPSTRLPPSLPFTAQA